MEPRDALTDDFIHRRHRVAVEGKSADRNVCAGIDKAPDGRSQIHDLVVFAVHLMFLETKSPPL
jgi:hypothetical protein